VPMLAGAIDRVAGRRFDIVVANLDSDTLRSIGGQLHAALADDGLLLGSGVSNERAAEVLASLRAAGLDVAATHGVQWSLLRGGRAGP
jgi:ribosomal protein L11 methylase PrmA